MKTILGFGVVLLLVVLGGAPAQALEPFVTVDNFFGGRIDKTIWNASQPPESDVLEFAREVSLGRLRLMNRSYNDTTPPGDINFTAVSLSLNNSDPVTAVRAWFKVDPNSTRVSGVCGISDVEVGHVGFFFKSIRSI